MSDPQSAAYVVDIVILRRAGKKALDELREANRALELLDRVVVRTYSEDNVQAILDMEAALAATERYEDD